MSKPSAKDVVEALRCSSSAVMNCKHESCHYWIKCREEEMKRFREKHPESSFPDDFFAGCDCDQICIDAADLLEELSK